MWHNVHYWVDIAAKFVLIYIVQTLAFIHENEMFLKIVLYFTLTTSFDNT